MEITCIYVHLIELHAKLDLHVGLSYIQTLRGYLVMGIPYMVVSLFVHLYMFVTSCAQYKHEAQFLVVHSWSQHPENPTGFFERICPHDASPEINARDAFAITATRLTLVPIVTQTGEEQIVVHPVGAPPTFTVQAETDILNNSDSDSPDPESELPMNLFPQEFNSSNDENFDVRPPVITLTDRILEHYHIPTWEDTTTRRNYYRIWTLLTSWTFVNNYLHVLNRHIRVDLIAIINNVVNLTRRYRTPHEDRWVTLTIWDNLHWIYTLRGDVYTEEATRLTIASHRIRFIEPRRQLALEAGVAWMHSSPSIINGPIPHSIELIQSLLHQANRTRTCTGWNVTALRQLQTEVNALVWRNDDFSRP